MKYALYIRKSIKLFYKNRIMPEYITFFVTNKCNSKCKHCFYWKNLNVKVDELTLDEIRKISEKTDDFLFMILTGGEPFIRKDLAEIAEVFYRNNNVQKINIATNGSMPKTILRTVQKIMKACPELCVALYVSIDDIGERHDKIRGVKGLYKKASETVKLLKKLKEKYPNLSVGVTMTYSSLNEKNILGIYDHIKKHIAPDIVNCAFVRGKPKHKAATECSIDNFTKLQETLKKDLINGRIRGVHDPVIANLVAAAKFELNSQLVRIVKEDRYLFPCYAGKINAVIYPNGDVSPCEMLDDRMGNLREGSYDFRKIWLSKRSDLVRKKIKASRCYCTHECNLLPNILYNPRFLPAIVKNYLRLSFGL